MNPKKVEYNEADTNMTYAASVLKANSGHPDYTNDIREEMQDKYPETIASFKDVTQLCFQLNSHVMAPVISAWVEIKSWPCLLFPSG